MTALWTNQFVYLVSAPI